MFPALCYNNMSDEQKVLERLSIIETKLDMALTNFEYRLRRLEGGLVTVIISLIMTIVGGVVSFFFRR